MRTIRTPPSPRTDPILIVFVDAWSELAIETAIAARLPRTGVPEVGERAHI